MPPPPNTKPENVLKVSFEPPMKIHLHGPARHRGPEH